MTVAVAFDNEKGFFSTKDLFVIKEEGHLNQFFGIGKQSRGTPCVQKKNGIL
jgi:hypothetical protein